MPWDEEEDTTVYKVVVARGENYALVRESRRTPQGWTEVGMTGLKSACVRYVEQRGAVPIFEPIE